MARASAVAKDDAPRSPRLLMRVLKLGFWVFVLHFAIQGGEYSTTEMLGLRSRIAQTKHDIDSLRAVVDSLTLQKKDVMTNPAVQERIAREEFGMVKGDKEIVYHLLRPDTAVVDSQ